MKLKIETSEFRDALKFISATAKGGNMDSKEQLVVLEVLPNNDVILRNPYYIQHASYEVLNVLESELEPGLSVIFPSPLIDNLIESIKKGSKQITLDFKNPEKIEIQAETGNYKMTTAEWKAEHRFPSESTSRIIIKTALFAEILSKLRASYDPKHIKFNMQGIFVTSRHDKLRFVATQGHTLYLVEVRSEMKISPVILSHEFIMPFLKVHKELPDEITIYHDNENAWFYTANGGMMTAKLINNDYVDYERVMPDEENNIVEFTVNRSDMVKALQFGKPIIDENKVNTVVNLFFDDGALGLEFSALVHSAHCQISYSPKEYKGNVSFNYAYLFETVNNFLDGAEKLVIKRADAVANPGTTPHIILPETDDQENKYALIMPVRGV